MEFLKSITPLLIPITIYIFLNLPLIPLPFKDKLPPPYNYFAGIFVVSFIYYLWCAWENMHFPFCFNRKGFFNILSKEKMFLSNNSLSPIRNSAIRWLSNRKKRFIKNPSLLSEGLKFISQGIIQRDIIILADYTFSNKWNTIKKWEKIKTKEQHDGELRELLWTLTDIANSNVTREISHLIVDIIKNNWKDSEEGKEAIIRLLKTNNQEVIKRTLDILSNISDEDYIDPNVIKRIEEMKNSWEEHHILLRDKIVDVCEKFKSIDTTRQSLRYLEGNSNDKSRE